MVIQLRLSLNVSKMCRAIQTTYVFVYNSEQVSPILLAGTQARTGRNGHHALDGEDQREHQEADRTVNHDEFPQTLDDCRSTASGGRLRVTTRENSFA